MESFFSNPATTSLLTLVVAVFFWWARERRNEKLRAAVALCHSISERILTARSPAEILERMDSELAAAFDLRRSVIYRHNRENNELEAIVRPKEQAPSNIAIQAQSPAGKDAPSALRAFRDSEALLAPEASSLYVPMYAPGELAGVFHFEFQTPPRLHSDLRAALQHLANQVAIALKLMEQQALREQILRSEKLGAAGELISGLAEELSSPLELMQARLESIAGRAAGAGAPAELASLRSEVARAQDTLSRLTSFSRTEQIRARPIRINELLAHLLSFRSQTWRMKSISVSPAFSPEDPIVIGAPGQLEQALLSLVIHAEHALDATEEKSLDVRSRVRTGRVFLEIDYSAESNNGDAQDGVWGLAVCRGIFENHGGTMRHRTTAGRSVFEVELPLAQSAGAVTASPAPSQIRPLTLLLAEPDLSAQRHLLRLLSARGHRVVPAATATEVIELAHRLRFDGLLSTSRLPDLNWVELQERTRRAVGFFVLCTDGVDSGVDAIALLKPVEESELDRVLEQVAP